ncbi:MAG: hypothetical protein R3F44_12440 [Candidatus Competibacteraceae bacterium]
MHVAAARFDPAVPPPGQFAVYNALAGPKELFVLRAGHFDHTLARSPRTDACWMRWRTSSTAIEPRRAAGDDGRSIPRGPVIPLSYSKSGS